MRRNPRPGVAYLPPAPIQHAIRELEDKGLSQGDIALQMGVTRRLVQRILGRQEPLRLVEADSYATRLGRHIEELYPRDDVAELDDRVDELLDA